MSRLFSKADVRALSSVVALVLLLGTIPLSGGVIIVSASGHPEISVNICTPIQILRYASNSTLARPALSVPAFALFFQSPLNAMLSVEVVTRNEPPDTPPPNQLV